MHFNLSSYQFWSILAMTSFAHTFRNSGSVEDISEIVKYSLGLGHSVTTNYDEDKVRNEESQIRALFAKSQGEITQLVACWVMLVSLGVEMGLVAATGGKGSFTLGMTEAGRGTAMLVYLITFVSKAVCFYVSRVILVRKERYLERRLAEVLLTREHQQQQQDFLLPAVGEEARVHAACGSGDQATHPLLRAFRDNPVSVIGAHLRKHYWTYVASSLLTIYLSLRGVALYRWTQANEDA